MQNSAFKKSVTNINSKQGKFSITYFTNESSETRWIPVTEICKMLTINKSELIDIVDSHCIQNIVFKNKNIECIDSLSLCKLNKYLRDEVFFNSIFKFSVWEHDFNFKVSKIIRAIPVIRELIKNNSDYDRKINYYDRAHSDIYHKFENKDEDIKSELKVCLLKRRNAKVEKGVSKILKDCFDINKIDEANSRLVLHLNANNEKKYNKRLTPMEEKHWQQEVKDELERKTL